MLLLSKVVGCSSKTKFGLMSAIRSQSPVQTRIRSLADKLNGMQSGLHDANRREHLEAKALELSERVVRSEQKEQQQFLLIKEKLKDFQGALKIEQEARLAVEDQLGKQIGALEQKLKMEIGINVRSRLDEEQAFNTRLTEHVKATYAAVEQQNEIREQQNASQVSQLASSLQAVATKIDECRASREREIAKLQQTFTSELQALTEQIAAEEKQRQEMEAGLYSALEEACKKLQDKIARERDAREKTHESILNLLDDVCGKVEQYV